jgi:hypothetical protein
MLVISYHGMPPADRLALPRARIVSVAMSLR